MISRHRVTASRDAVRIPTWARHREFAVAHPTQQLLDVARAERVYNAGLTPNAFARVNVAVLQVRINGVLDYLSAGNLPDAQGGIHSEQYLLGQVDSLKSRMAAVQVEQLYSERIPCGNSLSGREGCIGIVRKYWPGTAVFYSVGHQPAHPNDRTIADALRRAYGLR
jgi:hypothetical protein